MTGDESAGDWAVVVIIGDWSKRYYPDYHFPLPGPTAIVYGTFCDEMKARAEADRWNRINSSEGGRAFAEPIKRLLVD